MADALIECHRLLEGLAFPEDNEEITLSGINMETASAFLVLNNCIYFQKTLIPTLLDWFGEQFGKEAKDHTLVFLIYHLVSRPNLANYLQQTNDFLL